MIATNDLFYSWHLVYFYESRSCYLWTKRKLPSVYNPRKFSKSRFRVCVRYDNISDADIVQLFTRFINHPVEVNGRYCSFSLPGMGIKVEKGMELSPGLQDFIAQRNQVIDEKAKKEGSKVFNLEPVYANCFQAKEGINHDFKT